MKFALAALAFALSVAAPAFAQNNNVLVNTSATESSCTSPGSAYPGYFEASSFALGGTVPGPGGKLTLGNLIIGKQFDACSGILMTQFLTEARIPTVTLLETGPDPVTKLPSVILKIVLTDAAILNYSLADTGASSGTAGLENITFSYQTACIYTTPLGKAAPTKTCYNASTGVVN